MLGALGPHINSLRVKLGKTHPDDKEPHGWRRWAERVSERPWTATVVALAILIVLALPILQLELGQNDISALPKETTSRQAYDSLNKGFGPGVNGPLLIASEFSSPEEAKQVLPKLQKAVGGAADVAAVSEPTLDKQGTVAVFTRDLEIGAVGGRDRRPGRRPARRRRSRRRWRGPRPAPTSAARPPATSTSPPRSATSCR